MGTPLSPQLMVVQYRSPMPVPGAAGSPMFEGHNVTEFMDRYDDLCEEHGFTEAVKVKRLPPLLQH